MNGRYSHEADIADVGVSLAQMYIAETNSISDVDARIEMLQLSITNAKTDMSAFFAEAFYELAQRAPHSSDEQVRIEMERADILGSPHRMSDVLSKESMQAVAHWVAKSAEHGGPEISRDKSKKTVLFHTLAVEYLLRNDVTTSPIMKSVDRLQKAIARKRVWGRELAESIDRLENFVPANEEEERSNMIQKWKLMFVLRSALDKDNVPRSEYLSKEDDVVLTKRWKSTSVTEITQAFNKILTRAQIASMIIDSGLCELHTQTFIHTLSEKIEQLRARSSSASARNCSAQKDTTSTSAESVAVNSENPETSNFSDTSISDPSTSRREMSRSEFAEWLLLQLRTARANHAKLSLVSLTQLCDNNVSGGRLDLRVPGRHIWASRIAESISLVIGKRIEDFKLYNYEKLIDNEKQRDSLRKANDRGFKANEKLEELCNEISNVHILD